MKAPFDIAADLDTPVSAFLKLRPLGPCFLLESVEAGRLGRYSFLGLGRRVELELQGGRGREAQLQTLRRALAGAPRLRPEVPGLPFRGGLVGAAGFDLARDLLDLGQGPRAGAAAVARWVCCSTLLVFDHLTRRAALLHDGDEEERLRLRREVIEILRGPIAVERRSGRHEPPRASLGRGEFVSSVERAKGHIAAGDVYQLVLSIRFEGECDVEPFEVYRALRLLNPSPYMYFLDIAGTAVVGSSPEALVRLDGRKAALRPIAGTRPRGEDPGRDERLELELLEDPKEAAEHVMLVDLARNDLGRVAVAGSVQVRPFRTVERYSHVMHLVSGVEGVLPPERDAFDLFAAAFPAGTVIGAPKIRAIELIDEIEPGPRGLYAGTVGYFGHGGGMDQAITIRTLSFVDGRYSYQAGAGIVADSRPEAEYEEVLSKGAALGAALTLAEERS